MNANALDVAESLLAYLICAEHNEQTENREGGMRAGISATFDGGRRLQFEPMLPSFAYTAYSDERIFTSNAGVLLNTVQDIIGDKAEYAVLCPDRVRWVGYRKITQRVPRNVWIASPRASLYEAHSRDILSTGEEIYTRRVAAISKTGEPVPVVIIGSRGDGATQDGTSIVIAASIIEDAHHINALTATITEKTSIVLPVSIGEHKDLFALRDAPLTKTGRRKAILHWVLQHARAGSYTRHTVSAHWRGIRELAIDGLKVSLATNERV